jgi:hypothetical protein
MKNERRGKEIRAWALADGDDLYKDGPFHGQKGWRIYVRENLADAKELIANLCTRPPLVLKPVEILITFPAPHLPKKSKSTKNK